MKRVLTTIISFLIYTSPLFADILVPIKSIRPNTILSASDFKIEQGERAGVLTHPSQVEGMEARVSLYAGRPIRFEDLKQTALIERNSLVRLVFSSMGLEITTDGRSLDRGAAGDLIRVMNLSSKNTLFGIIQPNGTVKVTR